MTRRSRRLSIAVFLVLTAAFALDAARLGAARDENAAIARAAPQALDDARPRVAFAAAWHVAEQGEYLRALTVYRRLVQSADPQLRQAARYNSANLHLREAMRIRSAGGTTAVLQSLPLLELAKQGYRDVLRADPQHWDAKYNLERALRLAPEGDDAEQTTLPAPPPRERAVTTMQGFTLGLP
jgi:mxaK protein